MGTDTGRIFIQRVGYEGATIHTLLAPLTSIVLGLLICFMILSVYGFIRFPF